MRKIIQKYNFAKQQKIFFIVKGDNRSMKNLLVFVLVVVVVLTLGMGAHAAKLEFKEFAVHGFSLDLPDGWLATENKQGNAFDFNSPDGAIVIAPVNGFGSITFLYANSEGLYARTFAEMIAGLVGGSTPKESDNGDFEFTYVKGGTEISVRTRHVGHLGIVMESTNGFDNILSVLETLN
jgi:hypothetical protein